MPHSQQLWPRPDRPTSHSTLASDSMDCELRRQTRHPPARVRPRSISPRVPLRRHPAASPPSHLRQSSGFQIRRLPMLSGILLSPANPSLPKECRATARDTFPRQSLDRLSLLAQARVLPSTSQRILKTGRISSTAPNTFASMLATKFFSSASALQVPERWQTPKLRNLADFLLFRNSRIP